MYSEYTPLAGRSAFGKNLEGEAGEGYFGIGMTVTETQKRAAEVSEDNHF